MVGKTLGRYRIVSAVGSGGMGEVFLAEDPQLNRRIALKVLPADFAADKGRLHRFFQEARAAAALSHPNVAHIYELSEHEGVPFIAMEYVEGETLSQRMERSRLDVDEATSIAVQIASVLADAHRNGIVHRDIKPANVMIDRQDRVKVLDFGLARVTAESPSIASANSDTATLTRVGTVVGSPPYMSPEQSLGRPVDTRTDIFSFGAVLYEMIAARRPFYGDTTAELTDNIIHQEPEPVSAYNSRVSPELERIIGKCLEKDAALRYQSADDLVADLRRLQRDSGSVTRAHSGPRRGRKAVRRKLAWAISVAVLVIVTAGAAMMWQRRLVPARGAATVAAGSPRAIASLAVLPFVNHDAPEAQYLADGITQNLTDDLARFSGIRVMSRNSVRALSGPDQNARAAARKLGVQTVMTGSIRQIADGVRVNVEWIDASDGSLILSREYSSPVADVATLQSAVTYDVISKLRLKLTDQQRRSLERETADSEAYRLRLKGLYYCNRLEPKSLHSAIDYEKQAVARDPSYALAYSDMARAYVRLAMNFEPPKETMPLAKAMAYEALRIDDTLPDPRMTLGIVSLLYDWNRREAEREMISTSGIAPAAIEAFTCTAHLLHATGRPNDGEKAIRSALLTDPLSPSINTEFACNAYYQRHFDESVKDYRDALELDPRNIVAYWGLARALEQEKHYGEAVTELRKVKPLNGFEPPMITAEIAYALAREGRRDEATEVLGALETRAAKVYVDPFLFALVHLGLGDHAQTFAWLNHAVEARSPKIPSLAFDPKFDELRADSRFTALRQQAGI